MKILLRLLRGSVALIWGILRLILLLVLLGWGAGAIWWSSLPWAGLRMGLAVGFVLCGAGMLFVTRPRRKGFLAFVFLFAAVVAGWTLIRPTHNRPWAAD